MNPTSIHGTQILFARNKKTTNSYRRHDAESIPGRVMTPAFNFVPMGIQDSPVSPVTGRPAERMFLAQLKFLMVG